MSNTRSETVERNWPETAAEDELRLQGEFLGFLRATAVNKVAGLSRELAAATPMPASPGMSMLGVLKHLTAAERWWISIEGGGRDLPSLWAGSPDPSWQVSDEDDPASVVAAYRAEWSRSAEALAGMAPSDRSRRAAGDQAFTVRWILTHLIQETARHVGHLDFLRELADGETGE
jgi:uncharacterized damage-inducible protein DinB